MIIRFLNKDLPVRNFIFVVGEGILIYAAVLVSALFRSGDFSTLILSPQVLAKVLMVTLIFLGSYYFNDLYNSKLDFTYIELGHRLTRSIGIGFIILALICYSIPSLHLGSGIFAVSILAIFLGIAWRYGYNHILNKKIFTEKVLILGSGELCRKILHEISESFDSGYQITGWVPTNSTPTFAIPSDIPVYKLNGGIYELAVSLMSKKIVVAMDQRRGSLPTGDLFRCKMMGIKILEGESFYEKLAGKIFVEQTKPSWFIFSEGFRKSKFNRIIKRVYDLILASLGLLVASPLIGFIALAIKLDSKGPIIFKQLRCGEGERPFVLCKFRSMIDNAEADSGPIWAQDDDCRVTRVGRILRNYRLDEIPQMWNVVKGDMSFVGPRPERPEFVEKLKKIIPYYSERHSVKPGITGWAQVFYGYGASVEDALEKLKYDLFYIKNMNIFTDLTVICRTIKVVLSKAEIGPSRCEPQQGRVENCETCLPVSRSAVQDSSENHNRMSQVIEQIN